MAGLSLPWDNPVLEATADELTFFERVRLEATSRLFARLAFSDRRRLLLTIEQKLVCDSPSDNDDDNESSDFDRQFFKVQIKKRMVGHEDFEQRTVMELAGLKLMLRGVMARVKNWSHISLISFGFGEDRLVPILSWLSEAEKVSQITARFRGTAQDKPQPGEIKSLAQWIVKYSSELEQLVLNLNTTLDEAAVSLIEHVISQCQQLRRLSVADASIYDSTTFQAIVIQLPRLNGFSLLSRSLTVTGHSLSIYCGDNWLEICAQPTFLTLLGRMNRFMLHCLPENNLPLTVDSMENVKKIIWAMQSSATIIVESFGGQYFGAPQEVSLDKLLEQWLPLARDDQADIYLNIGRWYMTIAKYLTAMAALGDLQDGHLHMPTIASICADDQILAFYYPGSDAGRVFLNCCHVPDDDDVTLSLKMLCEKHLLRSLTLANACQYFSVASSRAGAQNMVGQSEPEQCASARLKNAAGRLILRNFGMTMTTVGWTALIHETPGLLRELLMMAAELLQLLN